MPEAYKLLRNDHLMMPGILKPGTMVVAPVFVGKDFQGQGVAKELIMKKIPEFKAAGLPIALQTENENNIPVYEKMGFKTIYKKYIEELGLYDIFMIMED